MSRRLRVLIGTAGYAGHAFPAFAAARELRSRGHVVAVQTFERWRELVEEMGMSFIPGAEEVVFPGPAPPGSTLPTIPEAARELIPAFREFAADVGLHDLYSLVPAFAMDAVGVPRATTMPHVYPEPAGSEPPFAWGLMPPRTPAGAWFWRLVRETFETRPRRRGREFINQLRAELDLAPMKRNLMVSEGLTMMQTFPQLEYPRRPGPPFLHATGPPIFELPQPEVELPAGTDPLIVVGSSSEQDPSFRLLRAALDGLAEERVRVLATSARPGHEWPGPIPANAKVVDWVSYSQVLPQASLVITNGGAGTMNRALAAGVPVIICPAGHDQVENGVRVSFFGVGLMLPRALLTRASLRSATRAALAEPSFAARAGELAAWSRENPGAVRIADLLERFAGR